MPKKEKPKVNKRKSTKKNLPLIPGEKDLKISKADMDALLKDFGGDKELLLFFFAYTKFGRNGTKAYKFLHPNCSDDSCRVLGARMVAKLAKVNISAFINTYDLGLDSYFEKIRQLMDAVTVEVVKIPVEKVDIDGKKKIEFEYKTVEKPNYDVQIEMHNKLGKILGIEGKEDNTPPSVAVQVNNVINDKKNTYGI